jgi:D-methionine transport system substrate-binding protein
MDRIRLSQLFPSVFSRIAQTRKARRPTFQDQGILTLRLQQKSVNDIPAGATIAIPNDPSNEARTLLLLETTGLIKLRPDAGFKATPVDIVENPKNIKFIELEAAQLARSLDDVHAAAVNTNYALQAGLNPLESLVREGPQSRYICEVVVHRQDVDKP